MAHPWLTSSFYKCTNNDNLNSCIVFVLSKFLFQAIHFKYSECEAQLNLPQMIEPPRIEKDHEIRIAPFWGGQKEEHCPSCKSPLNHRLECTKSGSECSGAYAPEHQRIVTSATSALGAFWDEMIFPKSDLAGIVDGRSPLESGWWKWWWEWWEGQTKCAGEMKDE